MRLSLAAAVVVMASAGCGLQKHLAPPANRRMFSLSGAFSQDRTCPDLGCVEVRFPIRDQTFVALAVGAVDGGEEAYDPPSGLNTQYDADGHTVHFRYGLSKNITEFMDGRDRVLVDLVLSASLGFIHVELEAERGSTSVRDADDGVYWDMRCGIAIRPPPRTFGFEFFFMLKATSIELFQGAMTGDTPLGAGMAFNVCF